MEVSIATRSRVLEAVIAKGDADVLSSRTCRVIRQHELLSGSHLAPESVAAGYYTALVKLLESKDDRTAATAAGRLGFAAQECSILEFAQHYQEWIFRLQPVLRGQSSIVLRTSCWKTLGVIYHRVQKLLAIPGVRKDASQPVREVVQAFLHNFDQDTEDLRVAKMSALSGVIVAVAPAVKSSAKAIESVLLNEVIFWEEPPAGCNARLAASQLLALLPQTAGEGAAWGNLMQQLIAGSHQILDGAFLGLEDPALVQSARAALQPRLSALAGDRQWLPAASSGAKEGVWLDSLAGLMDCMERLMTQAQPFPVPLPSSALFMLLVRLLSFDDSAIATGRTPSSASAYLELMGALPSLHAAALKLLAVWLRAGRSALTPFFASTCRLLSDVLVSASLRSADSQATWQARKEAYLCSCEIIDLAGYGAARGLLQAAKACATAELVHTSPPEEGTHPRPTKRQKKSKQAERDLPSGVSAMAEAARKLAVLQPTEQQMDCCQACQKLLQRLIRASGAMLEGEARLQLDVLALQAATRSSHNLALAAEGSLGAGPVEVAAVQLHLCCLETLLASVAAPSPARPALLPQAMQLFKQGLQSSNSALAAFCTSALLHCEAFLHPRTAVQFLEPVQESHLPPRGGAERAGLQNQQQGEANEEAAPASTSGKTLAELGRQEEAKQVNGETSRSVPEPKPAQPLRGMAAHHAIALAAEAAERKQSQSAINPEAPATFAASKVEQPEAAAVPSAAASPSIKISSKPASSSAALIHSNPVSETLSSDSEGPLPEIDLGDSSEEESSAQE